MGSSLLTLVSTGPHARGSDGCRISAVRTVALAAALRSSHELFVELCEDILERWKVTSFATVIIVVVVVVAVFDVVFIVVFVVAIGLVAAAISSNSDIMLGRFTDYRLQDFLSD
jgi:hypothetical protein